MTDTEALVAEWHQVVKEQPEKRHSIFWKAAGAAEFAIKTGDSESHVKLTDFLLELNKEGEKSA